MYTHHLVFCSLVDGEPYIVAASISSWHYNIYRCSVDAFPHGQAIGWEDRASKDGTSIARVVSALIPTDAHGYYSDREMVDVQWSPQGLNAIFNLYNSRREGAAPRAYTHITFQPTASLYPPTLPQAGSPIIVETMLEGQICSYHGHHSPWLCASTQSGNYKAIIIHDEFAESDHAGSRAFLHLLQFDGDLERPKVHDRQLELPFYIDLLEVHAIAIDERRGVIYLSHGFGHLFTVPYG